MSLLRLRSKNLKLLIFFLTLSLSSFSKLTLASDVNNNPQLSGLLDFVVYFINLAIISAGLVFVAMIAYGAWKSSMALGDPRGLEGAKKTWSYAVYGILVALGAVSIYLIVTRMIGASASPQGMKSNIQSALQDLVNVITGN